jgi:putative endonuclease
MWFIYILLCSDGSYYTGISNDVKQRFLDHVKGKGGAYTRSHKPVKLIYTEKCADKSSALKREIQIKKWRKAKKEALVKGSGELSKKL